MFTALNRAPSEIHNAYICKSFIVAESDTGAAPANSNSKETFSASGGDLVPKLEVSSPVSSSAPAVAGDNVDDSINQAPVEVSPAKSADVIKGSLDSQISTALENEDSSGTCDKKIIILNSTRLPDGTISYSMAVSEFSVTCTYHCSNVDKEFLYFVTVCDINRR